ncbi:M16 family metallopeptidase [Microlunatus ginsengisoli]|uniref:Pitrilysin family protein n=1 Tax=Microlunatus ginsengisoli TaxID=363863 RepID=A0ABP7A6X2_9ACTN
MTAGPAQRRRRVAYRSGEIRSTVLPGGLRVVTEKMTGSRTFSVGAYVGVGSRNESPGLHGASHFLEHVLFKGTPSRSAEQISAAIDAVGGDLNAYTAKEHTGFYARVLDVDAELAVDVLTDMIGSSLIRAIDVESERAVILDEIAMHADDPAESVQELMAAGMFGEHGLGRPVIGSPESVSALDRRQVVGHWRRHYGPTSTVVAAAGNVSHERLVERLSTLALPAARAARGPRPTRTATRDTGQVVSRRRGTEQCSVVLALPGPAVFDDRRYPVGLLSAIVGGGMSSRLFVEVRERRGLTYGIDAGETSYSDAGLWTIEWQCSPEALPEIVAVVRGVLDDVAARGVTDEELTRAKGQLRGQTVLAYENPSARMGRLGTTALMGDERTLTEVLSRYEAVGAEDLQREAAELFGQPALLAVVGPRFDRRKVDRLLAR